VAFLPVAFTAQPRRQVSFRPCPPILVDHPLARPGWLHEVKHDGCRIIARKAHLIDQSCDTR
jgi:ATP-dependent DNA ligase